MASMSDVSIKIDEEMAGFLMSTRLGVCKATACRFNSINADRRLPTLTCVLKRIDLGSTGFCQQFEMVESVEDVND